MGILVGLGLAYVWNGVEPASLRNVSAGEFQRDVTTRHDKLGPIARSIVIHPPEPNFEAIAAQERIASYESQARAADDAAKDPPRGTEDRTGFIKQKQAEAQEARARAAEARKLEVNKRVNLVTYKKLMLDPATKENVVVARQFIAEIPFVPPGAARSEVDPGMNVERFLQELQKRHDFINYSNGWWTTKPATYALWTIGAVVVNGGLWPIVLPGLVGAGLGRKHEPKPAVSLWNYRSDAKASTPPPSKPKVTLADQKRLEELTHKLEADLTTSGVGMTAAAAADKTTAAVRKLDGGPLEVAPLASNPDADDEIEIKGEYYPVLIHHKKHHDEPAPDADEKKD